MDYEELIPKHKSDFETIERLKTSNIDEIKPIVEELLKWLQDGHWEISRPLSQILKPHANEISDSIIRILKSNDEEWKYYVIYSLLCKNKVLIKKEIRNELVRIKESPTRSEIENEVQEIAMSALEKHPPPN